MKLTQTTYRLWLRTDINQTGYADAAAINLALSKLVANIIPQTVANPYDQQD